MRRFVTPSVPKDLFLVNLENAAVLAGERRTPGPTPKPMALPLKILLVLLSLIFFALVCGGLGWMAVSWTNLAFLTVSGVEVEGTLTEQYTDLIGQNTSTTSRPGVLYIWRYGYTTLAGQTLTGEAQVSRVQYETEFALRKPIQVIYLPNNPSVSHLPAYNWFPRLPTVIGLGLGALAIFVVFAFLYEVRRKRRFEADGQIIFGEVVEAQIRSDEKGATLYLHCKFTSPQTQKTIHQSADQRRDDLRAAQPPPAGTPVAAIYANDRQLEVL